MSEKEIKDLKQVVRELLDVLVVLSKRVDTMEKMLNTAEKVEPKKVDRYIC